MSQKINKPMHHGQNEFRNPFLLDSKGFLDVIRMRYFDEDWTEWEGNESKVPFQEVDMELINTSDSLAKITWIGHTTFLIQKDGINFLTDPVFYDVASPVSFVGPERVHKPAISMQNLPKIDFVLVSHHHYDHLDVNFVKFMKNKTIWIVPLGLKEFLMDYDIDPKKIIELDWYDVFKMNELKITATPAQHFSGRGLFDRNKTLWASFAVEMNDFKFWFGGDTGYNTIQFNEIGNKFEYFDLAIIPIGAYKPRWFMKAMHVNPEEAVILHKEVKSKFSVASHWGTFRLSGEGIDEPVTDLEKAKQKYNLKEDEFLALAIGMTKIIK